MKAMWKPWLAALICVVMLLIYLLPSLSLMMVVPLARASGADAHSWLRDGFPLITMILTATGLSYWAKSQGLWRGHRWRLGGRTWAVLVLVLVLVQCLVYVLAQIKQDITANDQAIMELFVLFPVWLMVFFVVVIAPLCEEIIFRGMLIGRVFARHMLWGVLVSTVLFAGIHMPEDLMSWLMYGGLGLAFALVYWRYRMLWPCVVLHMANNLLALADMQGWLG